MRADERNLWWRVGALLVWPIERAIFRMRVEGAEHVPLRGPSILVFNHVSVFDGPCLAIETSLRCRREIRFLVASEFFRRRFFGWVLRTFRQIPIRRGQRDSHALDVAIDTIGRGAMAAIAPEGTVNDDPSGGLKRIRSGIARIALPTGPAIVPVGIWGTQRRWSSEGKHLERPWRRPLVAIVYGASFTVSGNADSQDDVDAVREQVRKAIELVAIRARSIAERST